MSEREREKEEEEEEERELIVSSPKHLNKWPAKPNLETCREKWANATDFGLSR